MPQRYWSWSEIYRIPVTSGKKFFSWATLTYSTSSALYWLKQLFIIKTDSVKNGCSFPHEHFRMYPGLKLSFEQNSVRKKLFLSACFCWDSRLSLREMEQKFKIGGTIGYGDSYMEFFFVISKYLDYTQCCMMLLEQCGHVLVMDLCTVTWLDEE